MIQPVVNAIITVLLARFVLNDIPHALGLFGTGHEEPPTPGQLSYIAALCQQLKITTPHEERVKTFGEAGRLIRELEAEREHRKRLRGSSSSASILIPKGSTMYHATSSENADSILQQGLVPHSLSPWLGPQETRSGTYLSIGEEPAVYYARVCMKSQAEFGEALTEWALLKVTIPQDMWVEPDEEFLLEEYGLGRGYGGFIAFDGIPPEYITYIRPIELESRNPELPEVVITEIEGNVTAHIPGVRAVAELSRLDQYGMTLYGLDPNNWLWFNRLINQSGIPRVGTLLLDAVLEYCKGKSYSIVNQVSAYGTISQRELEDWYIRKGFVPVDYEKHGNTLLKWVPHSSSFRTERTTVDRVIDDLERTWYRIAPNMDLRMQSALGILKEVMGHYYEEPCVVAWDDSNLVGIVVYGTAWDHDHGIRDTHIKELASFTHEPGVGKLLVGEMMRIGREEDSDIVSASHGPGAREFYERLGFVQNIYYPQEPTLMMYRLKSGSMGGRNPGTSIFIPKGSTMYHTTSLENVDSILQEGLVPHSLSPWLGPQETRVGTYLSIGEEPAVYYAKVCMRSQVEFGEVPTQWALLRVTIPQDMRMEPDEEFLLEEHGLNHGYGGFIAFDRIPPEHITHVRPIELGGTPNAAVGTCYEDAWRFLIKQEEGFLVHGTVRLYEGGREVKHAWVELPSGHVWEPQTNSYFTLKDFEITSPIEEHRYTVEEAAIMAARVGKHGPWTDEERAQWLRR